MGAPLEKIEGLFAKFEEGAREAGKDPGRMPRVLQLHLSWAETDEQALATMMVGREVTNLGSISSSEARGATGDGLFKSVAPLEAGRSI